VATDLFPRPQGTLDRILGFEFLELGRDRARGRFEVTDAVRQPMGLVHGGAYAAFAESLASTATYHAVASGSGKLVMGQSNHTSFVRPATGGTVHVDARPRHRGQTTWVWEVDFTDDEGRLCAITKVTLAVRSAQRA
jgi:1,4-dihydroxy-2-naphthoyl-CoA hydrolase